MNLPLSFAYNKSSRAFKFSSSFTRMLFSNQRFSFPSPSIDLRKASFLASSSPFWGIIRTCFCISRI
ncbi:MAG: hypothetical protein FJW69_01705 [Actinobacteria bacterium]|nr:hypothetical protein [Actinomycetota bacterium]MBM3712084.1 hypothetical protein [Actinomycetota bacterium]